MAIYIAERVKKSFSNKSLVKVIDAFTCVGGNFIQFSKICGSCLGTEIDKKKVESCKKNCKIYGVELSSQTQIQHLDFMDLKEPPVNTRNSWN